MTENQYNTMLANQQNHIDGKNVRLAVLFLDYQLIEIEARGQKAKVSVCLDYMSCPICHSFVTRLEYALFSGFSTERKSDRYKGKNIDI